MATSNTKEEAVIKIPREDSVVCWDREVRTTAFHGCKYTLLGYKNDNRQHIIFLPIYHFHTFQRSFLFFFLYIKCHSLDSYSVWTTGSQQPLVINQWTKITTDNWQRVAVHTCFPSVLTVVLRALSCSVQIENILNNNAGSVCLAVCVLEGLLPWSHLSSSGDEHWDTSHDLGLLVSNSL